MDDLQIFYGDAVKALDNNGKVGGYLVRFGSAQAKDTSGEYFTKDTYLGPSDGNGSECLFHHSQSVVKGLEHLASRTFSPIKTRRDEVGIWAETVLNMSDEYEAKIHELVQRGKLGWSSGSAPHRVKKMADGQITSWPICEGSLTPEPAEPRNKGGILPLKSLLPQSATEEVQVMAKKNDEIPKEEAPKEEAPKEAAPKEEAKAEETPVAPKEETPAEAPKEAPKEDVKADGHSLLSGVHQQLSGILSDCEKAYGDIEPGADVLKTLEDIHNAIGEVKDLIADRAGEHYPDRDLEAKEDAQAEEVPAEAIPADKTDEKLEEEYKKLSPAQKAWVDKELAEIAKMQKQLDARRAIKANHERRKRVASTLRGVR